MISLWKASAKKLIYLFRVVLKGMVPFSPSWNPDTQKQVELDEASRIYIRAMSNILDERSKLMSVSHPPASYDKFLYPIRS